MIRAGRWEMLWSLQALLDIHMGFHITPLANCKLVDGDILNELPVPIYPN